ncbi:exported hypothetical protein [Candidatus Sulfopaludibacter sp. SbA3]|nr:exported hypothetical protein [Candidatus Sulfopaludibacter sp. SbA3]
MAAETRALYFADLASRYTRRKQWITGISFFLSSGAVASLIGKFPQVVPLVASAAVAVLSAYSMAVSLDRKIARMVKLHSAWNVISIEYQRLWNYPKGDDAEEQLYAIFQREKEPSELAATEAPNDPKLLRLWQDRVFNMHHLTEQHG